MLSSIVAASTSFAPTIGSPIMRTDRASTTTMVASTPKVFGSDDFCYGIPGAIAPLGNFDPLGFTAGADVLEVNRLREAELTHGRVGMLASLGFIVQEKFHPLFAADGGPAITQVPALPVGFLVALSMGVAAVESLRISKGFAPPTQTNLKAARAGGMSSSFQRLQDSYIPGDLGFDPLNLKPEDPVAFRAMQEKELSNGRLGMIAAVGFLAQEAVTGTTWGTFWGDASL